MDFNFENAVNSFDHNLEDVTNTMNDVQIDTFQLELVMRKQEMELFTMRKHVSQLREENDRDKQVIHDLKMQLNQANTRVASLETDNRIFKQNWDDLDSKHVSSVENKLQQTVLEQENTALKDLIRKSELEKVALQRKNDDLCLQQAIHEENVKKILEEDNNIRSSIKQIETLSISEEKMKVTELHNILEEMQKHIDQMEILKKKTDTYEKRTHQLEEDLTSSQAKLEMLEELLQNYSLPQNVPQSDLHSYFEEKAKDLEVQLEVERDVVIKQHEKLSKEINANVYLCGKIGELEKKLDEVERQRCKCSGNVENANI